MFLPVLVIGMVFFFFQAEDGIRDDLVTGVQTCALPISTNDAHIEIGKGAAGPALKIKTGTAFTWPSVYFKNDGGWDLSKYGEISFPERSEERRVGKECRSRWSPYH